MFEINTEQILILLVLFLLYKLSKCPVIEGIPAGEIKWNEKCPNEAKDRSNYVKWYKEKECPAYYNCARKCMRGEEPAEGCIFDQNPPNTVKNRWWEYETYTYYLENGDCYKGEKDVLPPPGRKSLDPSDIPGKGNNA